MATRANGVGCKADHDTLIIGSQKANKVKAYRLRQPLDKLQEIRLGKYVNAALIR